VGEEAGAIVIGQMVLWKIGANHHVAD
jgi:hypothetical protein